MGSKCYKNGTEIRGSSHLDIGLSRSSWPSSEISKVTIRGTNTAFSQDASFRWHFQFWPQASHFSGGFSIFLTLFLLSWHDSVCSICESRVKSKLPFPSRSLYLLYWAVTVISEGKTTWVIQSDMLNHNWVQNKYIALENDTQKHHF